MSECSPVGRAGVGEVSKHASRTPGSSYRGGPGLAEAPLLARPAPHVHLPGVRFSAHTGFPRIRGSGTLTAMHNHMLWFDWLIVGASAAYFVLCWIVPRGSW